MHDSQVWITAVAHNSPLPIKMAQNVTTVNTRSSVVPCMHELHYIDYNDLYISIYTGPNHHNNNNNIRLVTLAEHTSNHGKPTNSSTKEKGEHG